jgi:hypothetical protein
MTLPPRFAALLLGFTITALLMPASTRAQAALAPVACSQGYVWRQADAMDHVCVTPAQRQQTAAENSAAGVQNAGGTCVQGYVWRQADATDHVCVTPAQRSEAAAQNAAAGSRPLASAAANKAVRTIGTLTMNERLTLPESTIVSVYGRPFNLGRLRRNHAALVASRNFVKSLRLANLKSIARADYSFRKTFGGPQVGVAVPRPTASKAPTPTSPPQPAAIPVKTVPLVGDGMTEPSDYQQFCGSVPATVCLYFPANVTWAAYQGSFLTYFLVFDPLITDPNVCAAEGGTVNPPAGMTYPNGVPGVNSVDVGPGCDYWYPVVSRANFVPPTNGFSDAGWCNTSPGNFTSLVDSIHGAIQINEHGIAGLEVGYSPATPEFCFLQVTLN